MKQSRTTPRISRGLLTEKRVTNEDCTANAGLVGATKTISSAGEDRALVVLGVLSRGLSCEFLRSPPY